MKNTAYPLLSIGFLRSYFITMRPYLLFVSGAAGLVGLAYGNAGNIARTIIAFTALFLSYGLGQALTDCFQTDTDALSAPYRPLVKGVIKRKQVLVVSLAGLIVGVLFVTLLNPWNALLACLAVVGLLTYTPFKRTWWGGPPWNSWIVALLPLMGRLVEPGYDLKSLVAPNNANAWSFLLAVAAVFFGYANFVVMGYFKDISADRETGYRTFPVTFGWVAGAIYSDLTAFLCAALAAAALFISHRQHVLSTAIFVLGVIINVFAQLKIHTIRDESKTHGPIQNVVRSFLLFSIALILAQKMTWVWFMAGFYAVFELSLRLRPEIKQV
jgi:4-hydroxybenzoate polyprenyltransferase